MPAITQRGNGGSSNTVERRKGKKGRKGKKRKKEKGREGGIRTLFIELLCFQSEMNMSQRCKIVGLTVRSR